GPRPMYRSTPSPAGIRYRRCPASDSTMVPLSRSGRRPAPVPLTTPKALKEPLVPLPILVTVTALPIPVPGRALVPDFLKNAFAPVAGFGVTFRTMFRKTVTEQYPEQRHEVAPRFHGRHQLNRHPDGLEKCIGCELCAWACPADAIFVEGASNTEDDRYSPGERYGRVYQINYLRCILCGLCIEACPTRALTMTNEYELADNTRESLIYEKSDLLAPMLPGMEEPPHPMR